MHQLWEPVQFNTCCTFSLMEIAIIDAVQLRYSSMFSLAWLVWVQSHNPGQFDIWHQLNKQGFYTSWTRCKASKQPLFVLTDRNIYMNYLVSYPSWDGAASRRIVAQQWSVLQPVANFFAPITSFHYRKEFLWYHHVNALVVWCY